MAELSLASTEFENGGKIPKKYGYKHGNTRIPLTLDNIPENCASVAIVMDDPDAMAVVGKVWVHWIIWNIPPQTPCIAESQTLTDSVQGINDFGEIGYGGPAPPDKTHTYIFKLYALDSVLDLPRGANRKQLVNAMHGHIIAESKLEGTFTP